MSQRAVRYLREFDTDDRPQRSSEVVIVGSGVAGLRAALSLAEDLSVTVITKSEVRDSNTWRAQGGIAVVLQDQDRYQDHIRDTLDAGDGLCDYGAVETLVKKGPDQVRQLIEWGADFDKADGGLAFTREGGHGRNRVIHGRGDATGSLVEDVLVDQVELHPRINVLEDTMMVDLLADDERVYGVLVDRNGGLEVLWTRALIMASGGLGQVYRETTNHPVATGDGMAAALRAGLSLRDMEFIQFHPTTLYIAGGPRFLISEAVRGEGGVLRDSQGSEFMESVHPMAELAPRDIVSRAILNRMIETDSAFVHLDVSHVDDEVLKERFPTIIGVCSRFDIDITEDPIPVRPCAHYCMGGIDSDMDGRTSLSNLYCIGEVACTGAHGANRLASNSLLEGMVMGSRVRRAVLASIPTLERKRFQAHPPRSGAELDLQDLRQSFQSEMWREAGILREGPALSRCRDRLRQWLRLIGRHRKNSRRSMELMNMITLGRAITETALFREESRGAHYREDFARSREQYRLHSVVTLEDWEVGTKPVDTPPDSS